MTAVMRSLTDLLADPARRAGVTAVLDAADTAADKLADAQWVASFAPPITSFAMCPCGSRYECRGHGIDASDDEKLAAAEAVAELLGRPLGDVDLAIVERVIAVIDRERSRESWEAQENWDLVHEHCRGGDD